MWDVTKASSIRSYIGHENGVASVAASEDGTRLLTGSWDQTVRLWDVPTGQVLRTFTGHAGDRAAPRAVAFSPDVSLALSGANELRLWSLRPERQVRTLVPPEAVPGQELPAVATVSLAADRSLVVSASADGALRLWDVSTGLLLRLIKSHEGPVLAATFLPDGRRVLSAGAKDSTLKLWDMFADSEGGNPLLQIDAGEQLGALAVSPDGRQAVSGGESGKVNVWDLQTGSKIREHDGPSRVMSLCYSHDGSRLLAAYEDTSIHIIPVMGDGFASVSREGGFHGVDVARFQPGTSNLIGAGGWSGAPRLWSGVPPFERQAAFTGNPHGSTILDLVFTGDGRFVLTAGWDNTIRVWDVQRRELIRAFADHQRPVYSVDVSTDGDLAASASRDGTVRLWELSGVSDFDQQRELASAASKSLQSQPGNPQSLVSMANWYVARGAEPLALRLLSDAAAAGARVSNLQRARCYVALEMWSDAQTHYELAAVASEAPAEYVRACLLAVAAKIENRAVSSEQDR
jgi:WD40 repeat protein